MSKAFGIPNWLTDAFVKVRFRELERSGTRLSPFWVGDEHEFVFFLFAQAARLILFSSIKKYAKNQVSLILVCSFGLTSSTPHGRLTEHAQNISFKLCLLLASATEVGSHR